MGGSTERIRKFLENETNFTKYQITGMEYDRAQANTQRNHTIQAKRFDGFLTDTRAVGTRKIHRQGSQTVSSTALRGQGKRRNHNAGRNDPHKARRRLRGHSGQRYGVPDRPRRSVRDILVCVYGVIAGRLFAAIRFRRRKNRVRRRQQRRSGKAIPARCTKQ